jgi:hypothetical protein
MGVGPFEPITVYRGAPGQQREISAGDFVTTNRKLAEDYGENVIERTVPAHHIVDDASEPLGEEYIYRPSAEPPLQQWDYSRWYETADRPPRGGALVHEDGTDIFLAPGADLTTAVHEGAHAFLPEQLGWLAEFDPGWADDVGRLLEVDPDGTINRRSQEIYAYATEAWTAAGRPPVTQLRERWQFYQGDSKQVYGGRVKIPDEYAAAVNKALQDDDFTAWLTDVWDPLYGMQAGEGAFFISRRTPLVRNPLAKLRPKTGLAASRERLRQRSGTLEEQARDVLGPTNVLEHAERWQRHFEQEEKLNQIKTEYAEPIPVVDGVYDFSQVPDNYTVFNPDGLRGWTRAQQEAAARELGEVVPNVSLEEAFDMTPLELARVIHESALDIANQVFPPAGFRPDPREGQLYMLPQWVKDGYVQDMGGRIIRGEVLGRGLEMAGDILKSLNNAQRLRMYLAMRYVVLNVGATTALNMMHQGFFFPTNVGRAVKMAHSHPDHFARVEAEVGSGFYEALGLGDVSRGAGSAAHLLEQATNKVGNVVSRPEAFLRSTAWIHHAYRAGLRTIEQQAKLMDAAKTNPDARAYLNQLSRYAEEDVVRFRGLPPAEKQLLRAVFFVSGWLTAASRFAIRYPMNHPFWTTMLAQLGDDGWEEMRSRLAEYTQSTKYSIQVGTGARNGIEYSEQSDFNSLFPFTTAVDMTSALFAIGSPDGERRFKENLGAGGKLINFLLTGENIYGQPYSATTALDDFLISGTPLDYFADVFPGAFKYVGHERTPGKTRLDQTLQEYGMEWMLGRMFPSKYITAKVKEQYGKQHASDGGSVSREAKEWADEREAYHGQPVDEASMQAKTASLDWTFQWTQRRAELDDEGPIPEETRLVEIAKIKAGVLRKYGFIQDSYTFNADSAESLNAQVEIAWDSSVGVQLEIANEVYDITP